jgi:hypothetical protein
VNENKQEQPPSLPQYPAPQSVIQKPGMLGKMMNKMLKLPKAPKMAKMKSMKARKLKKQPHFY